jgi:hypothetical protein
LAVHSAPIEAVVSLYSALAAAVLIIHLTWIAWVIFGWLLVRKTRLFRWIHFASLIYSIFIEIAPLPCPLTLLEQWLEGRAGMPAYGEPFLVHYLDAIVYPDVPVWGLISAAFLICGFNLYLHLRHLTSSAPSQRPSTPEARLHP